MGTSDSGPPPLHRAQMLTASSNAKGLARVGPSAESSEIFLIDAETQKPVADATIEALPDEGGDNGYLVRVSKPTGGYRPELVRVTKGGHRTVPLGTSTADVPGRAVRLSQKVYNEDFLGEQDLAGVSMLAERENRPEIVFSPVLDGSSMMGARFNVYRSALPAILLAFKVEGTRPPEGTAVRARARVVSTSGPRRAGARVTPVQLATAGEKRDDDAYDAPTVSALTVATPGSDGKAMVSWDIGGQKSRVLAFEVGVDTTRPGQRVAAEARSLPVTVRKGEHFVCVRPVFPGSDLEPELRCQPFDAPEAAPAANVRVRVRPPTAGSTAPKRRQPMPVDVEVENLGDSDAPPFQVDVVLSRDGRSDSGLGEVRTIAIDGVKARSMAVRKTAITPPQDGPLYVVARADSGKQLIETNAEDNNDRLPVEVAPMGDNHSPVLSVAGTNVGGATAGRLIRGQPLKLRASADDQEDGDLSGSIGWYSSRDGKLADGASLDTTSLTPGIHRVRAQVSDHGHPAALRPQPSFWRRLFSFSDDTDASEIIADEPPETVTAEFTIEVVEPEIARAAQSPPVISAGSDLTTTVGGEVTPLATASDADGDALTFTWTAQDESGAAAEVLDATLLRPRFRPAAAGRYRLTLKVSDGHSEERDEMEVLALSPAANHPPEVSIRLPESTDVGKLVRGVAFAADPDPTDALTVSYLLTQRPPGSVALITEVDDFSPGFVPDLPGLYRLTIIADDGRGGVAQASAITNAVGSAPGTDGGAPDVPVPSPDGGTGGGTDGGSGGGGGPDGSMTGPPQNNGVACSSGATCQSGNCVEGVCCDSPCLGLCASCRRPNMVGLCGPVAAGQDPREDCPSSATCNGTGACSAFAVRPGGELVTSGGGIELAGEPNATPGSEEADRLPLACDPDSGLCAFYRASSNPDMPGASDLLVFDGRAAGPMQPRLISSNANMYQSPSEGSRGGFIRGTLLYMSTYNEVFAWRSGWSAPHRLSNSGGRCSVSRNGRYGVCQTNQRSLDDGTGNQAYDIAFGPLYDGGDLLPVHGSFVRLNNDNDGGILAIAPDERWLALRGRTDAASPPAIVIHPLPSGAPVTVLAEYGLDKDMQFSPDSRYLAFMRDVVRGDAIEDPPGTMAYADVSATPTVHNLLGNVNGFGWWQSPDLSVHLAFLDQVVNQRGSLRMLKDVTAPSPQPTTLVDRIWSPSGRDAGRNIVFAPSVGRLAVLRDSDDDQVPELWTVQLGIDTSIASQLSGGVNVLSSPTAPVFSPAGDQLAWGAMMVDTQSLFLSRLLSGGPPLLVGGTAMRTEFSSGGSLLFTEGDPYRVGATYPIFYGPTSTLRLYDGAGYPARVIQPGVRPYFAIAGQYALFVVAGQGISDGLYRIALTGTPPMSSCDPLAQIGCPNGQGCFLSGPGDLATCAPSGGGGLQATCGTSAECARGYQCLQGFCAQICSTAGVPCPGATPYCQTGPGNASLGVCLTSAPPSACDPVASTGCTSPDVCQVTTDGQHTCGPAGNGVENQPCGQNSDCGRGLGCFYDPDGGWLCRPYCDTRTTGSCPQQTQVCQPLGPDWAGYCVTGGGAPVCDPTKQFGCAPDQACYVDGFNQTAICAYPGSNPPGSPCSGPYDCARGLHCLDEGPDYGQHCRQYCYYDQPTSCPVDAPYCFPVGQGFGACSAGGAQPPPPPPPPPPMPDGGAQQQL